MIQRFFQDCSVTIGGIRTEAFGNFELDKAIDRFGNGQARRTVVHLKSSILNVFMNQRSLGKQKTRTRRTLVSS